MSKKPVLEIHGTMVGKRRHLTPVQRRVKKFLDDLPLHKVYTSAGLSDELNTSLCNLRSYLVLLGEKYRYLEGKTFGYGNPETIKLQKEGFYEEEARPEE